MPALRYDFDFQRAANWLLLDQAQLTAEPIEGTDRVIPIPPVTTTVTNNLILVGVTSNTAKQHWIKGCDAVIFFSTPPTELID